MQNTKWDLTYIFENDDKWNDSFVKATKMIDEIEKYENRIAESVDTFRKFLKEKEEIELFLENLYMYAHLSYDVDTSVSKYQEMFSKIQGLYSKYAQKSSYINTEYIKSCDKITEFLKEDDLVQYTQYFDEIFKKSKHILSEKEEKMLSNFSEIFDAPYNTFTSLNESDITFKDVLGKKLTDTNYTVFLESKDRKEREIAYTNLYEGYKQFSNTYARILETNVKLNNLNAKLRNYTSARNASLETNFIDEKVYDNLVDIVNKNLYRLHEYIAYRKKKLNLDKLRMYDVYVPITNDFDISYTVDEAKDIILEALKPLGEEYIGIVKKCFEERWIDFEPNDNKVGGAYSSGGHNTHPYILMTWNNNLSSLFTLAHEIGHSVHSYYSRHTQNYTYSSYTLFLAEIASTTNENLLTNYLLEKYKDNKKAIEYILNDHLDGYRGTVFRQTQFAEFEQEIHKLDGNGVPLTSDKLTSLYKEINTKYYGDNIEQDDLISYEWARIPHFYYNFYVYQYATGFSCAVYFANSILTQGEKARDKYINYLKAGCSKYPLEILADAGIDFLRGDIVNKALEEFSRKFSLLKTL